MSERLKQMIGDIAPGAVAVVATAVGLQELNYLSPELQLIYAQAMPFATGLAVGLGQNAYLRNRTFDKLGQPNPDGSPKTTESIIEPDFIDENGNVIFNIQCIDARIDGETPRVPGGYGPLGAEPLGLAAALAALHYHNGSPEAIAFAAGYLSGANILTTGEIGLRLLQQIIQISNDPRYIGQNIIINILNHTDGCGAEGITNPLIHWSKFEAHISWLTDVLSAPNEAAAWTLLNTTLKPVTSILTGGRVSIRPQLFRHSKMTHSGSH